MTWRDGLLPVEMRRTAIVAPDERLRRVLVEVADCGVFEPDATRGPPGPVENLADQVLADRAAVEPRLSLEAVEPNLLAESGRHDLLLGEATLERRSAAALHVEGCSVLPGWTHADALDQLRARIDPYGGAVAALPGRPGLIPPTAHVSGTPGEAFRPLVTTYATVPYRDLDPTLFAAIAYLFMFGMMFGDVAHGLAIVAAGLFARRSARLAPIRAAAPFLVGAGVSATIFGFLYGEAFGPTGLVPTLWIRPLDEPELLLAAGIGVGVVLLAVTSVAATVNRWREDGRTVALYHASGLGGALILFGGIGGLIGYAASIAPLGWIGLAVAVLGSLMTFVGLVAKAGGGGAGIGEALVEMFDTLLRLGSNVVSFTRLAAFGLTHAVMTEVVWDGSVNLWQRDAFVTSVAAVLLFALGNAAAFALGALVAAVQALRLEYYELFSRLFVTQGRPFDPWHVPAQRMETP